MAMSTKKDKAVEKQKSEAERHKKKSCTPPDNYGDQFVTGWEKLRQSGKGDKYRSISGWYSEEMTKRMEKIFGKKN